MEYKKQYELEMTYLQQKLIQAGITGMDKDIFIKKLKEKRKKNGDKWKMDEIRNLIHYAKGEKACM